ncbi:MAG: hypothetical protein ED557_01440 [Balneola sp.]|nr:MAG: hypothetical protein ED557_01440 [Balneola sp.]
MQFTLRALLLSLFTVFLSLPTFGQTYPSDLEYRKWRVTLFPPISTNGTKTLDYSARYSINLLAGYHGALDGYEIAPLFNYNRYYANGFQLSGLANITSGDMAGFNLSGLTNLSKGDMTGIQVSGFANFSDGWLEGFQVSGAVNYSRRGSSGLQLAGIANISQRDIEGLHAAGVFNYTKRDLSGLQAAPLFNYAGDDVEGLQATGGINFADNDISGLQAAGIANISRGSIEGLLASGVLNYAEYNASGLLVSGGFNISRNIEGLSAAAIANIARDLEGLQFAAINYSREATGLQIGLLNIAREFQGVPIGLLSIYGNGRANVETRFSDAGFVDLGITTGTHRVYNSFLFGYNSLLDRDVYRIGVAVALEKNIQDSFENIESTSLFVNQEFSVFHLFEGDWDKTKNRIFTYKYMLGKRFGSGASVFGGPSINMQVTRVDNTNDYTWYSVWSPSAGGRQYRFWVGFTIGVRVFHQKNLPLLEDDFNNWEIDW